MDKQVKIIMEGLSQTKGAMGEIAKLFINDELKSIGYIKECGKHIHIESVRKKWGNKLIKEIEKFCNKNDKI